ncbi:hypothetical protein TD95_002249 [Thielaviopsis punctulata]|uniref:rRNA methyltransferase 1, mitochondrial n=1 Tax=Thielaviopsis punctulata TaxID=72032 RepID=A0A0F4ZD53_9PEZI|nr:hypothetical protein TD95_002249 [Thielaviopsis punctulata]
MSEDANEEESSGRMSRRKRFHESDSEFGKKSLVYAINYGNLKETAEKIMREKMAEREAARRRAHGLPEKEEELVDKNSPVFARPAKPFGDRGSNGELDSGNRSFKQRQSRDRQSGDRESQDKQFSSKAFGDKEPRDRPFGERHFGGGRERRTPQDRFSSERRPPREDRPFGNSKNFELRTERKKTLIGTPIVPYTTAASQFLYGKSVVKSALRAGRRKMYTLYIYNGDNRKDSPDDAMFISLAKQRGIAWKLVPTDGQPMMDRMSQGRPHNGYVLEASPLPQPPVLSLGPCSENPWKKSFEIKIGFQTREEELINGTNTTIPFETKINQKPLVLLLHEVVDPGNLGGIIRTALFMGVSAVAVTKNNSATLTPVVMKSAAGAVEEIPIFTVEDSTVFIEESRKTGWRTIAAVAPDPRRPDRSIGLDALAAENPLAKDPCILVLGSEGQGIPRHLRQKIDLDVSIPRMAKTSVVDSLNVSVAAGLLCHAFLQDRSSRSPIGEAKAPSVVPEETAEGATSTLASNNLEKEEDSEQLF